MSIISWRVYIEETGLAIDMVAGMAVVKNELGKKRDSDGSL
ncbi:hypothetical protein [Peribacillus simplex]